MFQYHFWVFSFLCAGTESAEAKQERQERLQERLQESSQESWVQRMLMALVGDSALFNTREGRAGKVHNFMLGLNLNSCYPLSPLAELLTQESLEEEETAAVAGQFPERWCCVSLLMKPEAASSRRGNTTPGGSQQHRGDCPAAELVRGLEGSKGTTQ